ncbi:serine protease [Stratiformator vulcanicus]|uniref:TPR repeat-containing protein YrrB n=1 Tax=Stratiformator vulcanicus TaxID=2527980 RepID=A0A517R0D1_9PLAN|nr:serine protease [Stratiformator vulcanicus]QDT37349.1 TPR repeat-containing protein YrrB [Stratiformator vulcanicus]
MLRPSALNSRIYSSLAAILACQLICSQALAQGPVAIPEDGRVTETEAIPRSPMPERPAGNLGGLVKPQPKAMKPAEVYRHLLKSSAMVYTKQNEEGYAGTGTAWLVDRERKLFVTNEHVVADVAKAMLFFPKYEDGYLVADPEKYMMYESVPAEVLDEDGDYDLALLQAKSIPSDFVDLTVAKRPIWPGEEVFTVAGRPSGSHGMWVFGEGSVRQVSRGPLANGSITHVMESDIPINQGNSGAAVVDEQGQVVAVAEGFRTKARGTSLFIAARAVREYLDLVLPLVDPADADAMVTAGARHVEQGRIQKGLELFADVLGQDPQRVDALAERGWAFLQQNDLDSAEQDFLDSLKLNPTVPLAHQGLGDIYGLRGETDKAIDSYTSAIRNEPTAGFLYNSRGVEYYKNDYNLALADFSRAIKLDPTDGQFYVNRGLAHRELGDLTKSIADLQIAVKRAPLDDDFHNELGISLFQAERYSEAAESFFRATKLDDQNAIYFQNLADSFYRLKKYDAALTALDKSVKIDGESAYAFYIAGRCFQALDKMESAASMLLKSVELDSEDADAHQALGEVMQSLGHSDRAQVAFRKAANLNGEQYVAASDAPAGNQRVARKPVGGNHPLKGAWSLNQRVNGVLVKAVTAIDGQGNYLTEFYSTDVNGNDEVTRERGTITVDGRYIVIDADGQDAMRHQMQLQGEKLFIKYSDVNQWLVWRKQN